ncbi:MAG: methylenetetrahydrofolate reductase C-terminal domain-containing protein [Chloroflexi bacterium]|nr:methylenetetrahydrofolate reductase C-terminal domain-containing protein [Chloroflexota bacterium]
MIVAEQKPLEKIQAMIKPFNKVLIMGCGTCVTVCAAGGQKEVEVLASTLRLANQVKGNAQEIDEKTITRQCEWEYLDGAAEEIKSCDAVLSLGCGVGVQAIAERFPNVIVLPGLNTQFFGMPLEQGVWAERCRGCGDCKLDLTAGICYVARCAKSLQNGPCGGSVDGKCEVSKDIPCAWHLIYERLKVLGQLPALDEIVPPKDWSCSFAGRPRKIVREDLRITSKAKA